MRAEFVTVDKTERIDAADRLMRLARVRHLLMIQNSLDTCFPHNGSMARMWITTENSMLGDETPLAYMLNHGLPGIEYVSQQLSGGSDW